MREESHVERAALMVIILARLGSKFATMLVAQLEADLAANHLTALDARTDSDPFCDCPSWSIVPTPLRRRRITINAV